jgi:uncharacterized delta-60 repeat protein
MNKLVFGVSGVFVFLLNTFTYSATSAPGDLDPTFGGSGKVRHDFGNGRSGASAAVGQADGKIIVAGSCNNGAYSEVCVFRYNSDGSLDTSFDHDGIVLFPVANAQAFLTAIALQQDQRILLAGYINPFGTNTTADDFVLARLNPDGSLDTSFASSGRVVTDVGGDRDRARALVVQADGRIIVAGSSYLAPNDVFSAIRYNADGSLDLSFDTDGKVFTPVGASWAGANSAVIQPDGKLLLAGYAYGGAYTDFALVRYHPDGSLDTSFAGTGKLTTSFGNYDEATAVAIQFGDGSVAIPDRVVVAGTTINPADEDIAVARYHLDGSLDTTFDSDGKLTTSIGPYDSVAGVTVTGFLRQPRKIIVAGTAANGGDRGDFALVRYNANGSLDTTFDGDGIVTTPIASSDETARAMTMSLGRFVVAGESFSNLISRFTVARYNSDGSLDTTFDADGRRTDQIGSAWPASVSALALQADGRIVVGGSVQTTTGFFDNDFALLRVNMDGSLDTSFGAGGRVSLDWDHRDNALAGLAIQPDGKIVAAGYAWTSISPGLRQIMAFARFNTNGGYDIASSASVTSAGSAGTSVAVQPDGKIVIAGYAYVTASDLDFAVARFNPEGTLDGTFDGDGMLTTSMGTANDRATAVTLLPDGKIIVAGSAGTAFAAARYNPDGSLDTSFSFDGKVTTPVGLGSLLTAMSPDNGKILVAGYSGNRSLVLIRYNFDGSLDSSFDGDGILTNSFGADSYAYGLAIQLNRKILVSGLVDRHDGNTDFAIMRFNASGSLDTTYGSGGKVTVDVSNGGSDGASGLALDTEGKAVLAGTANQLFGVVRLMGDVAPTLTIWRAGINAEVSWPVDALGFTLQSTPTLNPAAWSNVPNSSTTNRLLVPNISGQSWFRLRN